MKLACVVSLLSSIALVLTGCVSYDYRDLERSRLQKTPYNLQIGDTVYIETIDGKEYAFDIDQVSEEAISGEEVIVLFDDIQIIRRKDLDSEQTFIDTGNMVLTMLAVFLIVGLAILGG